MDPEVHQWVLDEAARMPEFVGATLTGSHRLGVLVVVEMPADTAPRRVACGARSIDVSYLSLDQAKAPELVLAHCVHASVFRHNRVLIDDDRRVLTTLQRMVEHNFAHPTWVRRRVAHAVRLADDQLRTLDTAQDPSDAAGAFAAATALITRVLLVASLQDASLSAEGIRVWDVVAEHSRPDFYADLVTTSDVPEAEQLRRQGRRLRQVLPRVRAVADDIMRATLTSADG